MAQLANAEVIEQSVQENETSSPAVIPFKTVDAKRGYRFVKRGFDVVLSGLASIVLLIPVLILAFVIMMKDPGNPFYIHERIGKNGKTIRVLKLRTMRKGADKLEDMLTPEQLGEYHREYKLEDDPRLIGWKKPGDGKRCFGAVIRRLSLDEVPQIFWNVLIKGERDIIETTKKNVGFSRVVAA